MTPPITPSVRNLQNLPIIASSSNPSALKRRDTLAILRDKALWMEVDAEMHGDAALDPEVRRADAHPHAFGHGAAGGQHDGAHRR